MAQKSNILTIRSNEKNLNLRTSNTKEFSNLLEFIKVLKKSLNKKNILNTQTEINGTASTCYLNLKLFFKTQKLGKYKNILKNTKEKKPALNVLKKLLITQFKYKTLVTNISILNKVIDIKETKILFYLFKNFKNILFSRRFTLFIDFLKLTSLFIKKKINTENYLYILGLIFSVLPKGKHNRYLMFLKKLFTIIIQSKTSEIKGMKIVIKGKLKGKLRASSTKILVGKISNQTISANIEYSKLHVYTVYGAFGMKIWTNFN